MKKPTNRQHVSRGARKSRGLEPAQLEALARELITIEDSARLLDPLIRALVRIAEEARTIDEAREMAHEALMSARKALALDPDPDSDAR